MNALWAVGYPVTSIALRSGASPSFLAAVRLVVAFLMFAPLLLRVKVWSWRLIGFGALMGIIGFSIPLWLQTVGINRTSPAIAAVSVSVEPLFTILLAALLLRSRVPGEQRAAIGLALIGGWILTGEPRPGNFAHWSGDVALFLAIVFFAIFNVYSAKLFEWIAAGPGAALVFGFGAMGSTILWIINGGSLPGQWSFSLAWSLGFMAVGATGAAYVLWLYAVGRQSVTIAALFLYTQPLLGTLLSWALGESRITPNLVIGGLLILVAMTLGQKRSLFPHSR